MRERKKELMTWSRAIKSLLASYNPTEAHLLLGKTFTFSSSWRGKEEKLKQVAACFNLKLRSYLVSSKLNSHLLKKTSWSSKLSVNIAPYPPRDTKHHRSINMWMNCISCVSEFYLWTQWKTPVVGLHRISTPKVGSVTTFWTSSVTSQSLINFHPQIFLIPQPSEQIWK